MFAYCESSYKAGLDVPVVLSPSDGRSTEIEDHPQRLLKKSAHNW